MTNKSNAWLAAAVSAIGCSILWALTPLLTSFKEPWDAADLFYLGGLFLVGSFAGLVVARPLWAHYLGALIGQLLYQALFLQVGALFLLGGVLLLGYDAVLVVGVIAGGLIRHHLASAFPSA